MKKFIILMLIFSALQTLSAQNRMTIEECQEKARTNYPLISQYDLISKSTEYTLSNISKSYLPQFSLNGQATYQSEVTKLPIDFSSLGLPIDIKGMNKDQYKATIDVNQVVWDGGSNNAKKIVTKANAESERSHIEVALYQIKERVNQLYFGILAINEQIKLLDILKEDLGANKVVMQSMFSNGTITQSDLDQINVELLNIEQNRIEQETLKESFLKMLSLYTKLEINKNTILEKPQDRAIGNDIINRPELNYYKSQRMALEMQEHVIKAKNMPQVGLFAQGGYGRPGLNMLENRFKLFAIGGIKLSWNFGNLYTRKNERHQIDLNKNDIDIQEEVFLFNTNLQLTQQHSEIEKLKTQLEKDDEIITLRRRVKIASESKYKNGAYQINDLIKDINAENQARQQKVLREIQYTQSIYNYQYTQGN
ncbi:MAG: TolC family protein [Dysgonomonas sp.]